ncbi:MAG: VOC family protein [Lachnospiraceae bacterium]|nr:VOC family protein [Lachnospiraceae bacterium]
MKFKNPLIVVSDLKKSVSFYKEVLGLHVIMDFGMNVTLTGGVCLQTAETWNEFIDEKPLQFGGNDSELYFEGDDFDAFAKKLENLKIDYVHPIKEHRWGQRVVRFYDPDKHIIEVAEPIKTVCQRFISSGMTDEEVAQRMDVPMKFVLGCKK